MANYKRANVQFVDTTATFADLRRVRTIKFIGDLGSSAKITSLKDEADTNQNLWEQTGSEDIQGQPLEIVDHDLDIMQNSGIRVTVTGGAVVYLYIE